MPQIARRRALFLRLILAVAVVLLALVPDTTGSQSSKIFPRLSLEAQLFLTPQTDGSVIISVALNRPETDLSIVKIEQNDGSSIERSILDRAKAGDSVHDTPRANALTRYELRRSSEKFAEREIDRRELAKLTFLGGDMERALFVLTTPAGEEIKLIGRAGDKIAHWRLETQGGKLAPRQYTTPYALKAIELGDLRLRSQRDVMLTNAEGGAVVGLDGKPVSLNIPSYGGSHERFRAVLVQGLQEVELAEGGSVTFLFASAQN